MVDIGMESLPTRSTTAEPSAKIALKQRLTEATTRFKQQIPESALPGILEEHPEFEHGLIVLMAMENPESWQQFNYQNPQVESSPREATKPASAKPAVVEKINREARAIRMVRNMAQIAQRDGKMNTIDQQAKFIEDMDQFLSIITRGALTMDTLENTSFFDSRRLFKMKK